MSEQIKTISAEELYYTPISHNESEMIVEGMVPQGLTILAGAAKLGKSWLTLEREVAPALLRIICSVSMMISRMSGLAFR